jgi:hypothetical protein
MSTIEQGRRTPVDGEVARSLTADEARALTDQVKADAAALWVKLLRLYEGGAHMALGYSSWGAYYEAEFGHSARTGKRLLEAARNVDALGDTRVPPTQNAARELTPLRADPEALRNAWEEAVDEYSEPTAKQVRKAVARRRPVLQQSNGQPPAQPPTSEVVSQLIASELRKALRALQEAAQYADNLGLSHADLPPDARQLAYEARERLIRMDCVLQRLLEEDA